MRSGLTSGERALHWVGSSKKDLLEMPKGVVRAVGIALGVAQYGGQHPSVKPWKGEGPGILEVVDDFRGGTYRAAYTVRFADAAYVLHCFKKKSPSGIRTAKTDVDLISRRLKAAQLDQEQRYGRKKGT